MGTLKRQQLECFTLIKMIPIVDHSERIFILMKKEGGSDGENVQ